MSGQSACLLECQSHKHLHYQGHVALYLVVVKDAAARLQLVLVHKAEDGHAGRDDGVVLVNELIQVTNTY